MTRAPVLSLRTRWPISEWEFREAVARTREALGLPEGQRGRTLRVIAADYGVSARTLYRWIGYSVHEIAVGKYRALFVIGSGTPAQVTRWERAA